MEHNLEESLAMEGIENMDFEHGGVEVTQEDITLEDSSQTGTISMDMDTIHEQPNLLEEGSEEIIVSDFMGDQFGFQEYSVTSENLSSANISQMVDTSQMVQCEVPPQVQFTENPKQISSQAGIITIKAIPHHRGTKKHTQQQLLLLQLPHSLDMWQ